jgi:hypothetical protein
LAHILFDDGREGKKGRNLVSVVRLALREKWINKKQHDELIDRIDHVKALPAYDKLRDYRNNRAAHHNRGSKFRNSQTVTGNQIRVILGEAREIIAVCARKPYSTVLNTVDDQLDLAQVEWLQLLDDIPGNLEGLRSHYGKKIT